MENYDYNKAVEKDCREFIEDFLKNEGSQLKRMSFEEAVDYLRDICQDDDNVTGNASGSYTMSRAKAEKNLIGNYHLLADVFESFRLDTNQIIKYLRHSAEELDVIIRINILINEGVFDEVIEEFKDEIEEAL